MEAVENFSTREAQEDKQRDKGDLLSEVDGGIWAGF